MRAHLTYFPLGVSVDASKWTHFEDDGRDKGVMKLETEVGEERPSFAVICASFLRVTAAAETLDGTTCHPPPPMRCYCYRWLIPPSEVLFNSTREILHHSIHDSENILLLLHFDRVVNCGWKVCLCVWLNAGLFPNVTCMFF